MRLEKSPLDSIEMNLFRSIAIQEALGEKLKGPEARVIIENSLDWAKRLLPMVDGFFSSALTDQNDLIQYAVRVKACMEKVENLERSLAILQEKGQLKGMDGVYALVAIGYLEGELKGLKYTMDEMKDKQEKEVTENEPDDK